MDESTQTQGDERGVTADNAVRQNPGWRICAVIWIIARKIFALTCAVIAMFAVTIVGQALGGDTGALVGVAIGGLIGMGVCILIDEGRKGLRASAANAVAFVRGINIIALLNSAGKTCETIWKIIRKIFAITCSLIVVITLIMVGKGIGGNIGVIIGAVIGWLFGVEIFTLIDKGYKEFRTSVDKTVSLSRQIVSMALGIVLLIAGVAIIIALLGFASRFILPIFQWAAGL